VTSGILNKIQVVVDDIWSWLTTVYNMYGPPEALLSLKLQSLRNFHSLYEELCAEIWRIHRSILTAFGYIIYSLLMDMDG
jgi:hypothetical protein